MKKIYPNSFQSKYLNTFQVNVSILYPLKTGKPQVNSGVYREFVWNEMKNLKLQPSAQSPHRKFYLIVILMKIVKKQR